MRPTGLRRVWVQWLWAACIVLAVVSLALPASAQRRYTVRSGDTLAKIAKRFGTTSDNIKAANRMQRRARLRAGQELTIPPQGIVYVAPGQTLSHVARANQCTVSDLLKANRLSAGAKVRAGQQLKLPGYQPAAARSRRPADWGTPERPGLITLVRGSHRVEVQLVDADGRVVRAGLETLASMMRSAFDEIDEGDESELDAGSAELGAGSAELGGGIASAVGADGDGDENAMGVESAQGLSTPVSGDASDAGVHPRLAALLAVISDHFGGREIEIVSGLRKARGNTRQTSQHVSGHATDIRVRGVPHRDVWDYCRSLTQTGCGYYPRGTFVHVDVRERAAQWVDWSTSGRRPRYGTLARPYRRRELKSPSRPRVGRRVTRPFELPNQTKVVFEPRVLPISGASNDTDEDDASPTGAQRASLR